MQWHRFFFDKNAYKVINLSKTMNLICLIYVYTKMWLVKTAEPRRLRRKLIKLSTVLMIDHGWLYKLRIRIFFLLLVSVKVDLIIIMKEEKKNLLLRRWITHPNYLHDFNEQNIQSDLESDLSQYEIHSKSIPTSTQYYNLNLNSNQHYNMTNNYKFYYI